MKTKLLKIVRRRYSIYLNSEGRYVLMDRDNPGSEEVFADYKTAHHFMMRSIRRWYKKYSKKKRDDNGNVMRKIWGNG